MEQKSPFCFAERCLYNYHQNLSKIETLRERLDALRGSAVKAQSYEPIFQGGDVSRPVEDRAVKICDLEGQIAYCERCTSPITRLIADLEKEYGFDSASPKDLLRLLRLRYFAQGTWPQIAKKFKVGERTLRDWRQELVKKAIEYLCL